MVLPSEYAYEGRDDVPPFRVDPYQGTDDLRRGDPVGGATPDPTSF
jgi:hypothetical protein